MKQHHIGIGHKVADINTTAKAESTDLHNQDFIVLQDIQIDEAGHVTHNQSHPYTLPYGFAYFETDGNTLSAKNPMDVFSFIGDEWIDPVMDQTERALKLQHKSPSEVVKTAGQIAEDDNINLNFGDSFNSTYVEIDQNGHVATLETKGITLPQGSLKDISDNIDRSSVITSIGFTPKTGEITYTSQDLANLSIPNYELHLPLIGDINEDGIVDDEDFKILEGHVKRTDIITDQDMLSRMDVSGDGLINTTDLSVLSDFLMNTTDSNDTSLLNILKRIEGHIF
jgi:hypothetical protein